jgi:hypothetical protein
MDPSDAAGAAIRGRCAVRDGSTHEEQARIVIAFGRVPSPHRMQSERPCRDSDALIVTPWIGIT